MSNTNIVAQIVSDTEMALTITPNAVIHTTIAPYTIINANITPNATIHTSINPNLQLNVQITASGARGEKGEKGDTGAGANPEDGVINRSSLGVINSIDLETKTITIGRDSNGLISTISSTDGLFYTFFRTLGRISSWEVEQL